MHSVRKTQRKGSRSTQNIKRFKQPEQRMTLFEMFERFMAFKQTEGLAKPTIQGYYEHFNYLNDYLGGDVPNEEVTVDLFRNYVGYMLNDQGLKPTTINVLMAWGITIHKGLENGLINQIVWLLLCLGVIGVVISGIFLWWKRKPSEHIGAPANITLTRLCNAHTIENDYQHQLEEIICSMEKMVAIFY